MRWLTIFCAFVAINFASAYSQQDSVNACNDAYARVKAIGDGGIFAYACLFGPAVIAVADLSSVDPPVEDVVGKDPRYVTIYAECYRDKMRRKRYNMAMAGCVTGCLTTLAINFLFLERPLIRSPL